MEFYCIGTSHQNATLDIREKFSFSQDKIKEILGFYKNNNHRFLGPKSEIVILSTCNRFEVYVTFRGDQHDFCNNPKKVFDQLIVFLAEITGYSLHEIDSLFVQYENTKAIEHLFRVTCGLESQVLGEAQILGQVSDALSISLEIGSARHPLASLFQSAVHTAKRAHSETEISKNPTSISSAAVQMAKNRKGDLTNQLVIIVGAGEMSKLAAKAFHHHGAKRVIILNRTASRAIDLADQFSYSTAPYNQMEHLISKADVLITATSVQQPIITPELINRTNRPSRISPLLMLDISMPRNIDPSVRHLPGVELIDLDDLKTKLDQNIQLRKKAARQVEAIVDEELRVFSHWAEVMPTVGKLHRKAELIRRQEMEKMIHLNPDLDPQLQEKIDFLTRSLVKKILHEPSTKMRMESAHNQMNMYTNTLHYLFGLDEDENAYQIEENPEKHD